MPEHEESEHTIQGSPYQQAQGILASQLCGWISGHSAPVDHFLTDSEAILKKMHDQGIRFHLVGLTSNSLDGLVHYNLKT